MIKKRIRKWVRNILATAVLIFGLLLAIVLNPNLAYANKTTYADFTVYHNKPLDAAFYDKLDHASSLIHNSEFFNSKLRLDICLNDGSFYPSLIKRLRGEAFGWGFYNKVVLRGKADYYNNTVELRGYRWNLVQLLAHEMTHCLQFKKLGFWHSKPFARIAAWKWEGYAEYVARKGEGLEDLYANIQRLENVGGDSWEIVLPDQTIAPRAYYEQWLLVQFCLNIRKMSYQQLLDDKKSEDEIKQAMRNWFNAQAAGPRVK